MAERYAVQSGNWSDTATWDGGTLPAAGDDVHANRFRVTIDQDVTVATLSTRAGLVAAAGGGFSDEDSPAAAYVINADCYAGTLHCLILDNTANPYTLNGDTYGSDTSLNSFGAFVENGAIQNGNSIGGAFNNSYGSFVERGGIQNGDSIGGSSTTAYGSFVQRGGIQNGNSTGSSSSRASGSLVQEGGIQNGDSIGGSFSGAHGSFVQRGGIQNGSATGGSNGGANGSLAQLGGLLILSSVTDDTGDAVRLNGEATVILYNGITESDLGVLGSQSTFVNANYPFINEPGGGITGLIPAGRIISGGV